jgi:predicted AlkP superfamily pyrophosphatase or phosphodiesterase
LAIAWLKSKDEVAEVFTAGQVEAAVPPPGKAADTLTIAERFHESYDAGRSGDIIVALAPYASVGVPRAVGDVVAGHGSPWDYDRQVPILFWWPGIAAEQRSEPAETVDIAPTLAALLDLPAPPVDGTCRPLAPGLCPAASATGQPAPQP